MNRIYRMGMSECSLAWGLAIGVNWGDEETQAGRGFSHAKFAKAAKGSGLPIADCRI